MLGFFLQVGEADEPADGRLGKPGARLGIDILGTVEGRDHAPVMSLLDLAGHHVVVALGASDLDAEDQRGHRLSHGLRIVLPLVEKLHQPALIWLRGPGQDEIAHHRIPRAILAERHFEELVPQMIATLRLSVARRASHPEHIKHLPEVPWMVGMGQQSIDHEFTPLPDWQSLKTGRLLFGGNPPHKIQMDTPQPRRIVRASGWADLASLPTPFQKAIDHRRGGHSCRRHPHGFAHLR